MWSDTDLTEIAVNGVPTLVESALDGYSDGSGKHVNFIAETGTCTSCITANSPPASGLASISSSRAMASPPASNGSSLAAYSDDSGQHVYYTVRNFIVGNADVYELLS
jgi:hypothetical protein